MKTNEITICSISLDYYDLYLDGIGENTFKVCIVNMNIEKENIYYNIFEAIKAYNEAIKKGIN